MALATPVALLLSFVPVDISMFGTHASCGPAALALLPDVYADPTTADLCRGHAISQVTVAWVTGSLAMAVGMAVTLTAVRRRG